MKVLTEMKKTMTSKEIAKLTGKLHKNVLVDCRTMFCELEICELKFQLIESTGLNAGKVELYNLPKRECLILVSGYNLKLRAKIIDRWQELENTKHLTKRELIQINYEMAIKIEDEIDARIEVEKQCLIRLSKIGQHLAGSTISELENNVTFNNAAKILSTNLGIKLGHNSLMKLCREHGWLMTGRRSKSEQNMPTESKIQYFKIKLFYNEDTETFSITPVITPEGVVKLSELIPFWFTELGDIT